MGNHAPGGVATQLHIDNATFDFERKSHYLPHDELMRLLRDAGLEDVAGTEVRGERYEVFVGQRPVGSDSRIRPPIASGL